jgi:hypothetical protein
MQKNKRQTFIALEIIIHWPFWFRPNRLNLHGIIVTIFLNESNVPYDSVEIVGVELTGDFVPDSNEREIHVVQMEEEMVVNYGDLIVQICNPTAIVRPVSSKSNK